MNNISFAKNLLIRIARIGRQNRSTLPLQNVFPFRYYFDNSGNLDTSKLDCIDGLWTRREILTRYILIAVVLDQGPDIEGVKILQQKVINNLYEKEVRILH